MDTDALNDAAQRYQIARAELDQARAQLHHFVLEAVRAGVEQKRIVELTGMTRENIRVIARNHGIGPTR